MQSATGSRGAGAQVEAVGRVDFHCVAARREGVDMRRRRKRPPVAFDMRVGDRRQVAVQERGQRVGGAVVLREGAREDAEPAARPHGLQALAQKRPPAVLSARRGKGVVAAEGDMDERRQGFIGVRRGAGALDRGAVALQPADRGEPGGERCKGERAQHERHAPQRRQGRDRGDEAGAQGRRCPRGAGAVLPPREAAEPEVEGRAQFVEGEEKVRRGEPQRRQQNRAGDRPDIDRQRPREERDHNEHGDRNQRLGAGPAVIRRFEKADERRREDEERRGDVKDFLARGAGRRRAAGQFVRERRHAAPRRARRSHAPGAPGAPSAMRRA